MTRSKELRRIEQAIQHKNRSELEWALRDVKIRKQLAKGHSSWLYRLEKRIREALAATEVNS